MGSTPHGAMSAVVGAYAPVPEPMFAKGTSRRIFGELYKVIDSSDVIIHVLDARDPLGTLCQSVVDYIRKEKAHKQIVYLINKVDLVPGWVTVSFSSFRVLLSFHFPFCALFLASLPIAKSRSCSLLFELSQWACPVTAVGD